MTTETAEHTPGPWSVHCKGPAQGIGFGTPVRIVTLAKGLHEGVIIIEDGGMLLDSPNARLIAQAPTLLAQRDALADALQEIGRTCRDNLMLSGKGGNVYAYLLDVARTALASLEES